MNDAGRHGQIHPADVNYSGWLAIESTGESTGRCRPARSAQAAYGGAAEEAGLLEAERKRRASPGIWSSAGGWSGRGGGALARWRAGEPEPERAPRWEAERGRLAGALYEDWRRRLRPALAADDRRGAAGRRLRRQFSAPGPHPMASRRVGPALGVVAADLAAFRHGRVVAGRWCASGPAPRRVVFSTWRRETGSST